MSNPMADMEKADMIFCIGTNMTECHPVAATRIKKAIKRGATMVVADPRRIPLAELADLYLPIRVGSDVALLLGMAHVIEREGTDGRGLHGRAHHGYGRISRARQEIPSRVGPGDHRSAGGRHREDRAVVRPRRKERHLLHPGNHRAHLRRRQRPEPVQPGAHDRQRGARGHRDQPPARPEQHPGRRATAGRFHPTIPVSSRPRTPRPRPGSPGFTARRSSARTALPRSRPWSAAASRSAP